MCETAIVRRTLVALFAALVAACGGGSNAPDASATAGAGSGQTTVAGDTSGSSAPQAVATCDLPGFAADALALVNDYRARGASCGVRGTFGPAIALAWNTQLEQAAIAPGQSTVAEVVAAWMGSPDHCENIMNPKLREIALACVRNDAAAYRRYWTMDLGTPR
jgi:uncharacterized protein YkwD